MERLPQWFRLDYDKWVPIRVHLQWWLSLSYHRSSDDYLPCVHSFCVSRNRSATLHWQSRSGRFIWYRYLWGEAPHSGRWHSWLPHSLARYRTKAARCEAGPCSFYNFLWPLFVKGSWCRCLYYRLHCEFHGIWGCDVWFWISWLIYLRNRGNLLLIINHWKWAIARLVQDLHAWPKSAALQVQGLLRLS